jgi:hypothetical protein
MVKKRFNGGFLKPPTAQFVLQFSEAQSLGTTHS